MLGEGAGGIGTAPVGADGGDTGATGVPVPVLVGAFPVCSSNAVMAAINALAEPVRVRVCFM